MERKKILLSGILFFLIICLGLLVPPKNKVSEVIENKKIEEKISKNESLAIMVENDDNGYEKWSNDSWPDEGYMFNDELSKCVNGNKISFNEKTKQITIKGINADRCYIYFDKVTLSKYIIRQYTNQGENNLYYHDNTLEYGAGDYSYRYAGSYSEVNNWVCFGTDISPCPSTNLYRIIGVFKNENNKYQIKLIKGEYLTSDELGISYEYQFSTSGLENYLFDSNPTIDMFYWDNDNGNDWEESSLYKALNTNYLEYLDNGNIKWTDFIANTNWHVAPVDYNGKNLRMPKDWYLLDAGNDNKLSSASKIGLLYPSEYGYGAKDIYWQDTFSFGDAYAYDEETSTYLDWMLGIDWAITPVLNTTFGYYIFMGMVTFYDEFNLGGTGVRPVFYLNEDVLYISGDGTKQLPYRITNIGVDNYNVPKVEITLTETTGYSITINANGIKGDGEIKEYSFQIGSNGWTAWQKEPTYTFTRPTHSYVDENTDYVVRVRVRDVNNVISEEVTENIRTQAYNYPTIKSFKIVDATTTSLKVHVTFNNGDGEVNYIYITRSGDTSRKYINKKDSDGGFTYEFTNLEPGTEYTFKIDVYDNKGKSITFNSSDLKGRTKSNTIDNICSAGNILAGCIVNLANKSVIDVGNGELIYHSGTIDVDNDGYYDDAGDKSYRYSGSNPNNYVCLDKNYNGQNKCDDKNLYRIIGIFNNNNGGAYRAKLIKSEYITSEELGIEAADSSLSVSDSYIDLARVKIKNGIHGFYWNTSSYASQNNWYNLWEYGMQRATLNEVLNENYLPYLETLIGNENVIASTTWRIFGTPTMVGFKPKDEEYYEIVNVEEYTGTSANTKAPQKTSTAKIGLMYNNDYLFAAENKNNLWTKSKTNYENNDNRQNNWLFNGVDEWTLTRDSASTSIIQLIKSSGSINYKYYFSFAAVRPCLYLNSTVTYQGGDGSYEHPIMIS